jgi:hypothetical protein
MPTEKTWNHPQMRCAADGQQLGDALHDPQYRNLEPGELDESQVDCVQVGAR